MPDMNKDPDMWIDALNAWLLVLRAAGRPLSTVKLRRYQIERLARELGIGCPWDVCGADLVGWLGSQTWNRETLRSYRSAVRGFYRWAFECGYVSLDPALALPAIRPSIPEPRPAPEDAYRLALAGADARTRLMLRLAAELGLRRGEVAAVHADDLVADLAGTSLRVCGKGGRVRTLPITDSLAAAIRRAGTGYVFPGDDSGHLSAKWVGKLVARRLPGAWAMHSLRHRFATVAYSVDRDLLTVQQLLGHASPVTTRVYVRLPDESMRSTVAAVGRF